MASLATASINILLLSLLVIISISQQSDSGQYTCMLSGECEGQTIGIFFPPNLGACLEICKNATQCSWWNFDPDTSLCLLLLDCIAIDQTTCPQCLTGEKGCYEQELDNADVLLVTSGVNNLGAWDYTVELIPLAASSYLTCPAVPNYPDEEGLVGFVHEAAAVVCSDNTRCYKLDKAAGQWLEYAYTNELRDHAAGAFLEEDYIILGGRNSPNTTDLFRADNGTFSYGPTTPYENWDQCAATLNGTRVFMTGGGNGSHHAMSTGAVLDIIDGTWTDLPEFTLGRWLHGCGIATSAAGSSSLVVAGGIDEQYNYLAHTELLHLDTNTWSGGVALPSAVAHPGSVPFEDAFLLVGGWSVAEQRPSVLIWQFEPNNATQPWLLRRERLAVGRQARPVSILMKATDLGCLLDM